MAGASDLCDELKWIAEVGRRSRWRRLRDERHPYARAAGTNPQLRQLADRCGHHWPCRLESEARSATDRCRAR